MDPYSLAISLAPAVFKGITGLFQTNETVKRTDSTPDAFKESLALQRQQAASGTAPGEAVAAARLAQAQAAGTAAAARGSASSADFLAAAGAADGRRMQGEQQLGAERAKYHDAATRQLAQGLAQQAQYQTADDNKHNQAVAALKANGISNIFGGLSDAASAGVYALSQNDAPTAGDGFGGVNGLNFRGAGQPGTYDNPDTYGSSIDPMTGLRRRRATSTIAS